MMEYMVYRGLLSLSEVPGASWWKPLTCGFAHELRRLFILTMGAFERLQDQDLWPKSTLAPKCFGLRCQKLKSRCRWHLATKSGSIFERVLDLRLNHNLRWGLTKAADKGVGWIIQPQKTCPGMSGWLQGSQRNGIGSNRDLIHLNFQRMLPRGILQGNGLSLGETPDFDPDELSQEVTCRDVSTGNWVRHKFSFSLGCTAVWSLQGRSNVLQDVQMILSVASISKIHRRRCRWSHWWCSKRPKSLQLPSKILWIRSGRPATFSNWRRWCLFFTTKSMQKPNV